MSKNLKIGLIVGGIVLAILIVVPSVLRGVFGWRSQYWGMMGPGMMGGFGWGWLMPIFMILFWGLVIWGIVALARGTASCSRVAPYSAHADSALEVLKRRYARGEISKEEFEEEKRDLI